MKFLFIFYLIQMPPGRTVNANPTRDSVKNVCQYLGNRNDKNVLGSGNVALVVEPKRTRLLFVQQWKDKDVFDWASGTVRAWYPDRIEMNETIPPAGALMSKAPVSRKVFITRDDVAGVELVWKNDTKQPISVHASFTGILPGEANISQKEQNLILHSTVPYSDKVPQTIFYALGSSLNPAHADLKNGNYTIAYEISIPANEEKSLTLLLGTAIEVQKVNEAIARWTKFPHITESVRSDWNQWFNKEVPRFECSDAYFEKLYYYRWWSLYTKMIFAQVGHFYFPAPREGVVQFDGVVSYSGSCVSVDELRWMRNSDWAFSTTKEFFDPRNLNDGYLSNHIWDWGLDNDESNMDALGRSVPYHNYAVDAFRGALLVHPESGNKTLWQVWPQICSNLQSYSRLFNIDKDGLYETYPWSNSAGQEWTARYSYFDPIPEMFRNERSRTYMPDGSRSAEDMQLLDKIRNSVVTDPDLHWPQTADELYRTYYGTADHRLATVDQSTYAYRNFAAAIELARSINDTAREKNYSHLSEQARSQILSVMWNNDDRFFYDRQPVTLKPARVKATTGFYVFWARIAEQKHLPMLEHLFNPSTFWTKYPLPTLALDYERYSQLQSSGWTYWNYATWPRTTCHVVDGVLWAAKVLDNSVRRNAATLFDRYTRMHFPNGNVHKPNIAERYDPHTGSPFIENLDYNHSSWIDLVMQHIAGVTPQNSDNLVIDPVDMGWQFFSMKNVRYRNHDIDIEFKKGKGMTVRVDKVVKIKTNGLQKVVIENVLK